MKEIKDMNIGELAAYVCSYLFGNGIKCVLSGGACVSIYTENLYQSYDIDFIDNYFNPQYKIADLLKAIGFNRQDRYFRHNDTKLFIEFPTGPLSVGSETVKEISEIEFSTGRLYLLSPTDCVKDRLCAYFYWDDQQSLEQAIKVVTSQKVDLDEVRRWSLVEGMQTKFEIFFKKL